MCALVTCLRSQSHHACQCTIRTASDATLVLLGMSEAQTSLPGLCRKDIIGIILVKELVQELLIGPFTHEGPRPIAELRMRSLPMLYADMALYDMLHLFETGRSHMALLARSRTGHTISAAEAAEAFTEAPLQHDQNGKQDWQRDAHTNGHSEHENGEFLHAEVRSSAAL